MKIKSLILVAALVAGSFYTKAQTTLKNTMDSLSYAIGVNIGQNIKQQGIKVSAELLAKAIDDVNSGKATLIEPEACNAYIQEYFMAETSRKAVDNKLKGDEFLAENKKKAGVVTLPSGLQYTIVTEGTGAKPLASDQVKVHYEGRLIDGTIFDSSIKRGEPATFGVTQVIKGWVEALQLMPVGSKWTLFIPAELAYGQQAPPSIGPNQTLIFDVELIDIVK